MLSPEVSGAKQHTCDEDEDKVVGEPRRKHVKHHCSGTEEDVEEAGGRVRQGAVLRNCEQTRGGSREDRVESSGSWLGVVCGVATLTPLLDTHPWCMYMPHDQSRPSSRTLDALRFCSPKFESELAVIGVLDHASCHRRPGMDSL